MQRIPTSHNSRSRLPSLGSAYLCWATLALVMAVGLSACPLVSFYDPTSYQRATDLKAESLMLIAKATDPPAAHAAQIDALRLKLSQAYEYERGKGKPNLTTVEQWKLLNDPDGALLGGFLKKWQTDNAGQSAAFVSGMSSNVGKAFDQIIKLDSAKVKN